MIILSKTNLLRQVIEDDQSVPSVVAEMFSHRGCGIRRQVLQRSSIRSRG